MSKGSNRRPTDEDAYAESFDRIFGKKDKSKPRDIPTTSKQEARLMKAFGANTQDELLDRVKELFK